MRFCGRLPDVPVDPKFIELPKQEDEYVIINVCYILYHQNISDDVLHYYYCFRCSLYKYDLFHEPYVEAIHGWELHAEPDLGVLLDLIDPSFYEGMQCKSFESVFRKVLFFGNLLGINLIRLDWIE